MVIIEFILCMILVITVLPIMLAVHLFNSIVRSISTIFDRWSVTYVGHMDYGSIVLTRTFFFKKEAKKFISELRNSYNYTFINLKKY